MATFSSSKSSKGASSSFVSSSSDHNFASSTDFAAAAAEADFDEMQYRHFLLCDNPSCRAWGPRKRCSQCQSQFYCSVECQRAHWNLKGKNAHKLECSDVKLQRATWLAQSALPKEADTTPATATTQSKKTTIRKECGICLENTIRHPFALDCGHVFCFTCVADYQGRLEGDIFQKGNFLDAFKKPCPFCRQRMTKNIVAEATDKAELYIQRARRLLDNSTDTDITDERNELYRLATVQVEQVLAADPIYLPARNHKAYILMHENPVQAIAYVQETLRIDEAEAEKYSQFEARLRLIRQAKDSRDAELYHRLTQEFSKDYRHILNLPRVILQLGQLRVLKVYLSLAEAYEAAGQYQKARVEYTRLTKAISKIDDLAYKEHVHMRLDEKIIFGKSRCAYRLGEHALAVGIASRLLTQKTRPYVVVGIHKLIALPLLALAEKQGAIASGVPARASVHGFAPTLDGAMEAAYKGFVYEAQWDDLNKRANKVLLQELCRKKAAAAAVAEAGRLKSLDAEK